MTKWQYKEVTIFKTINIDSFEYIYIKISIYKKILDQINWWPVKKIFTIYKINKGLISEILSNFHFSERAQGRKVKSKRENTGKGKKWKTLGTWNSQRGNLNY